MLLTLILTLTVSTASAVLTSCPDTWTEWDGACYRCFTDPKTWADADTICQNYAGYLPSVHSRQENDKILEVCPSEYDLWIGLNDRAWEGNWVWSDGDPIVYTNWNAGEPDGQSSGIGPNGDVDCAAKNGRMRIAQLSTDLLVSRFSVYKQTQEAVS
uniref:Brevican core protein-like n=1 Tax=Saccoglossus kowalevskii TaxID=10224 RepID=A0ABM0MKC7_SACKO|nr:PREDICTED: brevican core protein-like [Saccoglossus kowalevskii]